MTATIPPDTRAAGQGGHIADHNNMSGVLTALNNGAMRAVALTPWFAGLANRLSARCDVVCLGDSITEGQHATGTGTSPLGWDNAWRARLKDLLRSRYPTPGFSGGGRGFLGVATTGESSFTWPAVIAGTPAPAPGLTLGPKAYFVNLANGTQTVTWSLVGDSFDVNYCQVFGGGTAYYTINGGSPVTFATGGTTTDGQVLHVSFAAPGANTVVVGWSSGSTVSIEGVTEYYGDHSCGIQVHDCGHFGWTAQNWVTALNGGSSQSAGAAIAALAPNLVIITLGVNDQFSGVAPAAFQSNLQTIIGDLKARLASPYPSFVLNMLPPRSGQGTPYAFPWASYVNAAYNVAAADSSGPGGVSLVTVSDFTIGPKIPGADSDAYGFWQSGDAVHPSNQGHQMIADSLIQFISQQP